MSGRYPYHLRATRCNLIPASVPEGLHLGYELLPKTLAKAGYVSHHVGKWHMGFHTSEYTPVGRGFNTSWGFLEGGEDHFTERSGAGGISCPESNNSHQHPDLWAQNVNGAGFPGKPLHSRVGNPGAPKPGLDSTYTAMMFTSRVIDIVKEAGAAARAAEAATAEMADAAAKGEERRAGGGNAVAAPFFVYWALHNTHEPVEAPTRFVELYKNKSWYAADRKRATFAAMVSVVDESVLNVTTALREEGLWANTLFVWTTDNGSPINAAGSNHPLRGGKGHNWEGGVRVPFFVTGGAVPSAQHGQVRRGLVHIADLYATFAGLAGLPAVAPAAGPAPSDSIDQWSYIVGAVKEAPRMEIIQDHHMFTNASATCGAECTCAGQVPFELPGCVDYVCSSSLALRRPRALRRARPSIEHARAYARISNAVPTRPAARFVCFCFRNGV